jgi:hypothetical protein
MPQTYDRIASVTVATAGTAFLIMDNIPSTYTDIVLIANASAASNAQLGMRFNNVSTTSYGGTAMGGNGSIAESGRSVGATFLGLDFYFSLTTTAGASVVVSNIMNYSNTTTHKTVISRANNAAQGLSANVGRFASTSAISRIDIISQSATNIAVGSTFTLYGIKAA